MVQTTCCCTHDDELPTFDNILKMERKQRDKGRRARREQKRGGGYHNLTRVMHDTPRHHKRKDPKEDKEISHHSGQPE